MNSNVATAAGAQGFSGGLSILLMYGMNVAWGWTFPPEVSLAFSTVLGVILHWTCAKLHGCDLDGDGKPDTGAVPPAGSP